MPQTLLKRLSPVILLVAGFCLIVLFVSPARSFPMNDDWAYARSVGDLLRLNYRIPDWAQATCLTQIAWGAIFAEFLGDTFTALSLSNIVMGLLGLVATYLFLREFGTPQRPALLGAFLLVFNPIYLFLTYSFMTDITFLVCCLGTLLCYGRALGGRGDKWLWLGSIAASLAFLTRQFGALLVVALLICLLWNWKRSRATRQVLVMRLLASSLLPAIVIVAYQMWESEQPFQLINLQVDAWHATVLAYPSIEIVLRLAAITSSIAIPGLLLLPTLRLTKNLLPGLIIAILLLPFEYITMLFSGTVLPVTGNILDHNGLIMYDYPRQPVWPEPVWTLLTVIGLLSLSFCLGELLKDYWRWLATEERMFRGRLPLPKHLDNPALALPVVFGVLMLPTTAIFPMQVFDRYFLPFVPLLLLANLRRKKTGQDIGTLTTMATRPWTVYWRLGIAAIIAIVGIISLRDYMDVARLHWATAQALTAQGVPANDISAGFEWEGQYLFPSGLNKMAQLVAVGKPPGTVFPSKLVLDPEYMIGDLPVKGYKSVETIPYTSWMAGFQTREMQVWQRSSATKDSTDNQAHTASP